MTYVARVPLVRDGPGYLYMGSKTAYVAPLGPYVAQLRPHVPQLGRPETISERFWSPRDLEKLQKVPYRRRILKFSQFRQGFQKGGPKIYLTRFLRCIFGPWGAIWLQKGAVGRSDPIFGAFLTILDRFLTNMFDFL